MTLRIAGVGQKGGISAQRGVDAGFRRGGHAMQPLTIHVTHPDLRMTPAHRRKGNHAGGDPRDLGNGVNHVVGQLVRAVPQIDPFVYHGQNFLAVLVPQQSLHPRAHGASGESIGVFGGTRKPERPGKSQIAPQDFGHGRTGAAGERLQMEICRHRRGRADDSTPEHRQQRPPAGTTAPSQAPDPFFATTGAHHMAAISATSLSWSGCSPVCFLL